MSKLLSRRTVLQGLGTAVALPWLEAMSPTYSWAKPAAGKQPVRMAFLYVPNGMHMPDWTPAETGHLPDPLPPILRPLSDLRGDFSVLSGLTSDKARAPTVGGHARGAAAYLTGARPRPTAGSDFRLGVSADQIAASRLAGQTRLTSLELGCDIGSAQGECDPGWSCAYLSHLSWRDATTPLQQMVRPAQVFDRLFSADAAGGIRAAQRRSILDYVREEATSLQTKLGSNDRRKLDEYFSAIRDIEQRIERAARLPAPTPPVGFSVPATNAIPTTWEEHVRLLGDLMVLAFQTDSTRVCTFTFANEFSVRMYPELGFSDDHHTLSHHMGVPAKQEKISKINTWHATQLAYILNKLRAARDGDGSLLDHCMVAYGSGISDGNVHSYENLPILLAGRGGGSFKPGRHIRFAAETPLANLWLSMLDRMDAAAEHFGDSTGRLVGL